MNKANQYSAPSELIEERVTAIEHAAKARPIWRARLRQAALKARASLEETRGADDAAGVVIPQEKLPSAGQYGSVASTQRLTKVISAISGQSATVIGVTGARTGAGVSVTSRELAGALANFGTKTMLVDLSQIEIVESGADVAKIRASSLPVAVEVRPFLSVVAVEADRQPIPLSPAELRAAFADAVREGFTVVADLPPVLQASGVPNPSIAAAGTACDLVFLVCPSGEISDKELGTCVETCRVVGLKLGGLILNDWRMFASALIGS